jgi:ribonuclease T1
LVAGPACIVRVHGRTANDSTTVLWLNARHDNKLKRGSTGVIATQALRTAAEHPSPGVFRVGTRWRLRGLALTLAFVAWIGCGFQAQARQGGSRHPHETVVQATRLDREALLTLRRVRSGGPFPYAKDGIVFGNYEHQLPHKPRGYYREYTVPTPGSRDRGARRIVCGGAPRSPDVCYYTHDHYASFQFIAG